MSFIFIFPPQWIPMNPHFSLYSLAGHAAKENIDFRIYDLNLEFYRKILTPKYLDYSRALACNARDYLYTRIHLGRFRGDKDQAFARLCARFIEINKYLNEEKYVWEEVKRALPETVSVFANPEKFYDPPSLLKAYVTIDKALELISLPFYPNRLRFNDFAAPGVPMTTSGMIGFSADTDENPFYMYAQPRLRRLVRELPPGPNVVGFSINSHSQFYGGLTFARILKSMKIPNLHINLGGNYFVRIKETLLERPEFMRAFADSVSIGEGEETVSGLIRDLDNPEKIPNLIYLDKLNNPRFTFKKEAIPLKERALPNLDGIKLKDYFIPEIVLSTRTSKGCYWQKCTFCDADYGVKPDSRPPEHVAREWSLVKEKYGIENFELIDEAMSPSYMRKLAPMLTDSGLKIHYFGNGRTESAFTLDLFESMKASGLTMVLWGVESGSERIMKLINKGVDFHKRLDVLRAARNAGLWNFCFIFFGFPSETEEEAQMTIDLIRNNRDIINAYGRSVFTLGKHSKIRMNAKDLGIVDMITDDQEFSTIMNYTVSKGLSRAEALRVADRCRLECAAAYDRPLWMFLRHREVIHLYLKEKGADFMENYRMPDDEMVTIETLYKPASTEELKFGYISNADSP